MFHFRHAIVAACLAVLPLAGCRTQPDRPSAAAQGDIQPMFDIYQAGRLTSRLLISKAAGLHPREQDFAALQQAYQKLKIAPAYFQRVPRDPGVTYQAMAEVMVLELGREIKAAYGERGDEMQADFGMGLQMTIVQLALRTDVGGPSQQTRDEIQLYLREILPQNARNAGWSKDILAFFADFDRAFAAEKGVPRKSREVWDKLIEWLNDIEKAKSIMR